MREELLRILAEARVVGLTQRLRDRFGDHGLVAVMLGVPMGERSTQTIRIDTWLMSCRVIGRTAEHFLFGEFMARSRDFGYQRIIGEYIPTQKNALVAGLYEELGFRPMATENATLRFGLDLDSAHSQPPLDTDAGAEASVAAHD